MTKKYWWTVILLYPKYMNDSGVETYVGHVKADTLDDAVEDVRKQATDSANNGACDTVDDPMDFKCVGVIYGRREVHAAD